jgi:elongation factor Ts
MAVDTKLIQQLRQMTGAGISDCKKALEESAGDLDDAIEALRKKGLAKSASRETGSQGTIGIAVEGDVAALVEVKCETDFVAASEKFKAFVDELAQLVLAKGEAAVAERTTELEDLKILLKEGIAIGTVARFEAAPGNVLGTYLHLQGEGDKRRGVNGVIVELAGGTAEQARAVAMHCSFAKPRYLTRDDVPAEVVAKERAVLEEQTRNEGKPEQALPKIVEGKLNGFFKEVALVEQPYIQDEKQSVGQWLGSASVVRFAQAYV